MIFNFDVRFWTKCSNGKWEKRNMIVESSNRSDIRGAKLNWQKRMKGQEVKLIKIEYLNETDCSVVDGMEDGWV